MKKFFVLTLAAVLVSIVANAQTEAGTTTIYPRIGVNMSTLTSNDLVVADGYTLKGKYKFGFTAGAEVKHQFTQMFAASAGMLYSLQGGKNEDYEYRGTVGYYCKYEDVKNDLHYLNLPVLAIFGLGESGFSLKCGVQAGYLLSAKSSGYAGVGQIVDGDYVLDESDDIGGTVTNAFNRFDFSIPVGVAYETGNLSVDLRFNIGLTKTYKYVDEKSRNNSIVLVFGYGINL